MLFSYFSFAQNESAPVVWVWWEFAALQTGRQLVAGAIRRFRFGYIAGNAFAGTEQPFAAAQYRLNVKWWQR